MLSEHKLARAVVFIALIATDYRLLKLSTKRMLSGSLPSASVLE